MSIYCDHNASTPLRPEALDAMLPFLRGEMGNPSSVHRFGSRARCAVEDARAAVARLIGSSPAEIVFTSGGTESNNLAIAGTAARFERPGTLASLAIEHSSVREPLRALEGAGWRSLALAVDDQGWVTAADVAAVLPEVELVSIAWANNELGTVQPISAIGALCRSNGVLLHSDAVQAVGKLPVSVEHVDMLSISAHKLGGPKGVGALYVRSGVELVPLLRGGGQERERRGGTENVAGIVGFGVACQLAALELEERGSAWCAWREALWSALERTIPGCQRNSPSGDECLPNTLHVSLAGVRGEALVAALDLEGIAISSGSACAAGAGEPSHVLLALGRSADEARNGVRLSCGHGSTMEQVPMIVAALAQAVSRIREARP